MNEPVDIFIERIDSILSHSVSVPQMKLDAQGFECQILDGMSPEIATNIRQIKFELAGKWLRQQGCMDLLPRLRNFGYVINDEKGDVIVADSVNCGVCDAYATKKQNQKKRKRERENDLTSDTIYDYVSDVSG